MKLTLLPQTFAVCKISDPSAIDWKQEFLFFSKTDEELSLVCPESAIPIGSAHVEKSWRGFRINGKLDFSLIGILAKISDILAKEEISIFAVSTFNTDYIFLQEKDWEKGLATLSQAGYEF